MPKWTKANEIRRQQGVKTTQTLYKLICKEPGKNVWYYSKKLDWTYGKAQKAAAKLLFEEGLIKGSIYKSWGTERTARALFPNDERKQSSEFNLDAVDEVVTE